MGMCAVKGPRVLHDDVVDDGEVSARSGTSMRSSASGYGSPSTSSVSLSEEVEVDAMEASDHVATHPDGALWRRTIPKGRRCKQLSFSGMILYDANGKKVDFTFEPEDAEEEDDDEYFSPHPRVRTGQEDDLFSSPRAVE